MKIIKYKHEYKKSWDAAVRESKNGTFLFFRDYLEYHSDRFIDYSLLFFDENDLLAVLPASIDSRVVTSHGGLTYGGLVYRANMTTKKALDCFESLLAYLRENGVEEFVYKAIPYIYHKLPADEDLYCLFINGFELIKREVSSSIPIGVQSIRGKKMSGHKKAVQSGCQLLETRDAKDILNIVNKNLSEKYSVNAVHTFSEMNYLNSKFRKNIRIFDLIIDGECEGGAILYANDQCVHAQYIATSAKAKLYRGLDFIVVECLSHFQTSKWFDFGISTENGGRKLNLQLIKAKEEFNMAAICYDTYAISL